MMNYYLTINLLIALSLGIALAVATHLKFKLKMYRKGQCNIPNTVNVSSTMLGSSVISSLDCHLAFLIKRECESNLLSRKTLKSSKVFQFSEVTPYTVFRF